MMAARVLVLFLAFQSALGQRQVVDVHLEEAVGNFASGHVLEERSMRQGRLRTAPTDWSAQSMQIARLHRSAEASK